MSDTIKRDDAPEPCLFCRGEAEVFEWEDGNYPTMSARVECECGAKGKCCGASNRLGQLDAQNGLHRQRAIAAWNTRALPATDPAAIREAALQARIEELVKGRDGLLRVVTRNHVALQRAEAKLTKAVEALRFLIEATTVPEANTCITRALADARAVLAELEGGK